MSNQANTSDSTGSQQGGTADTSKRGGRNNRGKNNTANRPRYKGKCNELERFVYDDGLVESSQDMFTTTTREIAEYIGRTYDKAGELRTGLVDLELPKLIAPSDPSDDAGVAELERYKIRLRQHMEKESKREENLQKAFALILGQCSQTVHDRLEGRDEWERINNDSDVIGLLKAIRESLHQRESSSKKATHGYIDAERAFINFRQGGSMSNSDFFKKLKSLADTYVSLGGEPGTNTHRVNEFLTAANVRPDKASESERAKAEQDAREEYLAILMITKSDRTRYEELINSLTNGFLQGHDGYPTTTAQALDMLNHYKRAKKYTNSQSHEVSYMIDSDSTGQPRPPRTQDGGDRTGRGNRGGRTGRGDGGRGRGGRGRGRDTGGRGNDAQNHAVVDDGEENEPDEQQGGTDHEDQSNNTSTNGRQYFTSLVVHDVTRAETCLLHKNSVLPHGWLLLDSCSTVDIIVNKEMLHDIHEAHEGINVHCNARTIKLNKRGYLGEYPYPVWFNPDGVANILSLYNVSKQFRVTMDTATDNSIVVHREDGHKLRFTPSTKGIYKFETDHNDSLKDFWTLITTVDDMAGQYTKSQVDKALLARRLQNTTMRPSSRDLIDFGISSIQNCPINRDDILAADNILGPNLGSLKGKTVRRATRVRRVLPVRVPAEILNRHKSIFISIDIFFINKVAFFTTYCRELKFRTVTPLLNRQSTLIRTELNNILRLYKNRGFLVSAIYADPEFDELRGWFPQLETCGVDDHIGDVERSIRTIKD